MMRTQKDQPRQIGTITILASRKVKVSPIVTREPQRKIAGPAPLPVLRRPRT